MRSKKKRTRQPSSKAYLSSATLEESGIHLPAFMMGAVTSLLALMLAVSYFATPAQAKRVLRIADNGGEAGFASNIERKIFDQALDTGNHGQLNSILSDLNQSSQAGSIPKQFETNRRRVDAANQMLELPLSENQRILAIDSKLDALGTVFVLDQVHNLGEPNIAATLATTASAYVKDGSRRIARTAKIAMFKHHSFTAMKRSDLSSIKSVATEILSLLSDYPGDEEMISTIKMAVGNFSNYGTGSTNRGLQLLKQVRIAAGESQTPVISELIEEYSDDAKMHEREFKKAFANISVNGKDGQCMIVQTSLELLSDRQAGNSIIANVDNVSVWFEQAGEYEQCEKIYNAMLSAADHNESADVATKARRLAEDGLKRIGLVGQKFDFAATLYDQSQLDPQSFQDKTVIVFFWSPDNFESCELLKQLYIDTAAWRTNDGVLLAVTTDIQPSEKFRELVSTLKDVYFTSWEANQIANPILQQCPADQVPRAMLVDRNGIVANINVPISEVKTEASYLSTKTR